MDPMDALSLLILDRVFQSQPVTRQALSAGVKLGASGLNSRVAMLIGAGLLIEEQAQVKTQGRPPRLLSVSASIGRVAGLDIDGERSYAVVSDVNGHPMASAVHPTQAVPDRATILDNLSRVLEDVCQQAGVAPSSLAAIGIGVRAIVNTATGVVLDWPNTPSWAEAWKGLNLSDALSERTGVDLIIVDDSVRSMGVAANRFGVGRGVTDFLYLFLGTGIGSCVFLNGRPYPGSSGISGELGHVVIDEEGPWCSCGSRGCLETLASTSAVLRQVRERLALPQVMSSLRDPYERGALSLDELVKSARVGDKLAFHILVQAGNHIGKVVAIALNLLGPEMVILGGPLAKDGDTILSVVRQQVRLRALQHVSESVRIVCDDGDEMAGARGAAIQAWEAVFDSPERLALLVERSTTRGGAIQHRRPGARSHHLGSDVAAQLW